MSISLLQTNILKELYTSTRGPYWFQSWNLSASPTTWFGVQINNGNVIGLSLSKNNLNGTLPSSLGQLSEVTLLDFRSNLLRGPLPPELGQLTQLQGLTVSNNLMTGPIPFSIGDATSMTAFDIHNNSFTGSLPVSFGNMTSLEYLDIRGNPMTGKLGEFLCPLNGLSSIYFDRPICYAYCLGESVIAYGTSFDPDPIRCQSPEDLAICAFLQSTDLGQYINITVPKVPICSPANYTFCASTNLTSTHRSLRSIDREATLSIPNAVQLNLYFNQFTDFLPEILLFCDTPSCGIVYYNFTGDPLSRLPGLQPLFPFVTISSNTFFMRYKSNGCGVLTDIQVNCWGYTLYVDAYIPLNLDGNWKCTAPPSPEVAYLPANSRFWDNYIVPYSESYGGNFNGWTGVEAVTDIIRTLDLSGIGLYGTIPSNIGLLKSLEKFSVFDNHLNGTLPKSLLLLTEIVELQLSINSFSGTLNGSLLGKLPNLEILGLSSNAFTGPLPTEIVVEPKNSYNQRISHSVDLSSNHFTGQLSESLCSLNYTVLDVSGNQLGCYASCWKPRIQSKQVLVGGLQECLPSQAPSPMPSILPTAPVNTSLILTIALCVGLAIPVVCLIICLAVYCVCWRNRKKAARKGVWRTLPAHKAIVKRRDIDDVLKAIRDNPDLLASKDFDGHNAFEVAVLPMYTREDPFEQHQVLIEIVKNTLPIDSITKEKRDPSLHGYIWCRVVQSDKYVDVVSGILSSHSSTSRELAYATDAENRPAINIASPQCQLVLKEFLYFLKRYEFITPVEKPLHKSATCMIVLATDHQTPEKPEIALKLMKNLHQFETEVSVRESIGLEDEFVVSVLRTHRADYDPYYLSDATSKGFETYKYCTVMPAADRNLATIISSERIAGKDWPQIKLATLHIAKALEHVHEKGFIHGDIKPLNIMRIDNKYKLIDFDAGAPIGIGYSGSKFSSAYAPPEMIFEAEPDRFLVKHVSLSDPSTFNDQIDYLPYELLPASAAHDIWSFGVVLYELFSGIKLFLTDDEDNLDDSELEVLYEFPDEFKKRKLDRIGNTYARNLVSQLLMKDPSKRPSMTTVLSHPFITGGKATRLVGDVAEFDVFISYRVKSDASFALLLYHALIYEGLKVWLDSKSLEPGVSWEDGFADGLIKSSVFVPILSRGAVNDLTNDRQNFAKLVDVSPCDNVFLEHCLALEFQHRGLIERVYPVLLGDAISVDGEEGFEHYFNTGCHPDLQGYVVVKSVREKIDFHLDRLCLGTPLVSDFSVRSVEKEVLSNQGKVADGAMKPLIVAITQDIKEMMVGLYQHTKNVNKLTDEFKMLRSQKLGNSERFRSQSSISESAFGTPRSKLSASSRSNMSDNHMVALVTRSLDEHKVDDHSGVTEVHALLEQDSERNSDDTHSVNRITSRASSVGVDDGFGVAADDTEEAKSSRSVISPQSIEYKIVPNE